MSRRLVFKVEEICQQNGGIIDTTMFIYYDHENFRFYIYGNRIDSNGPSEPYSLICNSINDLIDFTEIAMYRDNNYNYTIYNLPIVNGYAANNYAANPSREIAGYDNQIYNRSNFLRYIKLLCVIQNNDEVNNQHLISEI
jgi:hypothetical protein